MATTVSRLSEGFQRLHQNQKHTTHRAQQHQQQHQLSSPSARMKRPLDPIDNLSDPLKPKRTRISVEIYAKPLAQALGPPKPILVNRQRSTTQPVQVASSHKPERPSPIATNPLPPVPPPTYVPTATTAPPPPPTTATTTTTTTTAANKENGLTRHQEKVINGIRHELGRLQPSVASTTSTSTSTSVSLGRKLRSQEATRFKSELSAYFPEYDEVIGNDTKEQYLLNADTPIIIIDSELESSDAVATTTTAYQHPTRSDPRPNSTTVRVYSDRLFTDLHNSPITNFDFPKLEHNGHDLEDPLPDSRFAPTHRRAERLEKSIRNTERGRAQHEKDQIIRLLGELQGHDWLRTMGVNGVTESRRKSFEPARDHFIKGCQAILNKFRLWSQEEKRRKLERERALAEESDDEEDEDEENEDEEDEEVEDEQEGSVDGSDCSEGAGGMNDVDMVDIENESGDDHASEGDPPEYSDVDEAARQLHDEAMERARYAAASSPRRTRGEPPPTMVDPAPREFTSFFEKRHQRDAALIKGRRRGRTILAWGHPVPETSEIDFELPDFCLDEDTLRAHERQKRRERRQRKQ
ncbi:hypothetical protein E0Z10_g2790 [Xylaria hypoxylon]|uniref:Something about silencing protein 4 domain-containing protein n=1 Tax=Xylaria hypoxylon TaxID=37992 RepID=A0A4Z0Z3D3_9PEZI|nr:hypothetical protein E0Z10_g2790 [Xylaria hypoxylon]